MRTRARLGAIEIFGRIFYADTRAHLISEVHTHTYTRARARVYRLHALSGWLAGGLRITAHTTGLPPEIATETGDRDAMRFKHFIMMIFGITRTRARTCACSTKLL